MPFAIVLITSIASAIGFTINTVVMSVILLRGKRTYHLLFALLLLVAACWDLGIFLVMIRNNYPNEIILYSNLLSIPISFFPALVYHFTTTYLGQPQKKSTIAIYTFCVLGPIGFLTGPYREVSSVYNYGWGTIGRYDLSGGVIIWYMLYHLSILISCWFLVQARKMESSSVTRRHILYILVSFIVFSVAQVKVLVTYGVDVAFVLPLGIIFVDLFGAVIGMAIMKHQLFDITVLVRKGIVYSIMVAAVIFIFDFLQNFVFDFLQDLIAEFLGGIAGEQSGYIRYASMAILIIVLMPLRPRLERAIDGIFSTKRIKF